MDKSSGFQNDTVDLSNESRGMYFVSIIGDNFNYTSKVIKN